MVITPINWTRGKSALTISAAKFNELTICIAKSLNGCAACLKHEGTKPDTAKRPFMNCNLKLISAYKTDNLGSKPATCT